MRELYGAPDFFILTDKEHIMRKDKYYQLKTLADNALVEGRLDDYIKLDLDAANYAVKYHKEIFGEDPTEI